MKDVQYQILSARRQGYDNLIWQMPPILIAAQAILLNIAFDKDISSIHRLVISLATICVGLVSTQSLIKHRFHEKIDANMLEDIENTSTKKALIHGKRHHPRVPRDCFTNISSFCLWVALSLLFVGIDAYAAAISWGELELEPSPVNMNRHIVPVPASAAITITLPPQTAVVAPGIAQREVVAPPPKR